MFARALSAALFVVAMMYGQQLAQATEAGDKEAPESAVSSPPMEMDDPGTPGPQGIEANLVGSLSQIGTGRSSETLLDLNYGIGDRLQLKLERPYLTQGGGGTRSQKGLGATELGVKWRFIERNGFEVAAYPQYQFADGFTPKDEEGNPEEAPGRSVYAPLLISKRVKDVYTLAANLGYRRNLENRGDDLNLAIGAGWSLNENTRILAEVFSERDEHLTNRETDIRFGYFGSLFSNWFAKSLFELDEFASLGHSIGGTEVGEPSTSFTLGVSFVKKSKAE